MAWVVKDVFNNTPDSNHFGCINTKGKIVIPFRYGLGDNPLNLCFVNNLCWAQNGGVYNGKGDESSSPFTFINKSGKTVLYLKEIDNATYF